MEIAKVLADIKEKAFQGQATDIMLKGLDGHLYQPQVSLEQLFGPEGGLQLVLHVKEIEDVNHTTNQMSKIMAMNEIARNHIKPHMPIGMGFIFMMFDYGDKGNLFYAASAVREDCINVMKEWIQRSEQ